MAIWESDRAPRSSRGVRAESDQINWKAYGVYRIGLGRRVVLILLYTDRHRFMAGKWEITGWSSNDHTFLLLMIL